MNCETQDFTDRTNKAMTTNHPLATHDDEARHEEISSHSQTNFVGRLRQLYGQTRYGAAEKRQACVAKCPKWWRIWSMKPKTVILRKMAILLVFYVSLPASTAIGATYYLEPGETKVVPLDPRRTVAAIGSGLYKKGTYMSMVVCLNGTRISMANCNSPDTNWGNGLKNMPLFKSSDSLVSVTVLHDLIDLDLPGSVMGWGATWRIPESISGTWNLLDQRNPLAPGVTSARWDYSAGSSSLPSLGRAGAFNVKMRMTDRDYSLGLGDMLFTNTTASLVASTSAVPGSRYTVPAQYASSLAGVYEVFPASTIIISHPCFVRVPAVQNIPFGNVFVSGVPIGTESTTVIQNEISCAGAVANRKYTITSTGTATGATSIPLKETGGGGTTQGNIYIKTATGGGCSTSGARTMGTAYTLPVKSGNTYGQDLYATLCNVANGASGPGSATATITYDWN